MAFKIFDMECPKCGYVEADVMLNGDEKKECPCGAEMRKLPSGIGSVTFGRGRSAESYADYTTRLRERLTKRASDYDRTPQGEQDKGEAAERLRKRDIPV